MELNAKDWIGININMQGTCVYILWGSTYVHLMLCPLDLETAYKIS